MQESFSKTVKSIASAYQSMYEPKIEEDLEEIEEGLWYTGSEITEAQKRYSPDYQFTHTPGDKESEKRLADLKAKHKGTDKRVVLQGRLGKNNPNAYKYSMKTKKNDPKSFAGTGAHSHQRIKKADAAHHDVYVYKKSLTPAQYKKAGDELEKKYPNRIPVTKAKTDENYAGNYGSSVASYGKEKDHESRYEKENPGKKWKDLPWGHKDSYSKHYDKNPA